MFCVLTSVLRVASVSADLLLSVNMELLLLSVTLAELVLVFVSVDLLVDSISSLFTVLPLEFTTAGVVLLLPAVSLISSVPVVLLP